tara:strand:+ start:24980 stop:25141 length:162 start_codon:yes stop_codon:yes gene_type:complete
MNIVHIRRVAVISGVSSAGQMRDDLTAVDVIAKLTPGVQQEIAALLQSYPGLE